MPKKIKLDNDNRTFDAKWEWLMFLGSRLGCHQMPERSFFVCGYQFPLCARCMGLLVGYIVAIILWLFIRLPLICSGIMCIPLVVDGMTQYVGLRESNQLLRLTTGILCGIGSIQLEITIIAMIIKLIEEIF